MGTGLCLAMIDLDNFKAYNDRHGHQAGDLVLKEAATAWQAVVRKTDMVTRYGGEEFTLLLPACALADAAQRHPGRAGRPGPLRRQGRGSHRYILAS